VCHISTSTVILVENFCTYRTNKLTYGCHFSGSRREINPVCVSVCPVILYDENVAEVVDGTSSKDFLVSYFSPLCGHFTNLQMLFYELYKF